MTAAGTDHENPRVTLVGLRGCGKSAVGRELAELIGGDCVDTDELIVQEAGKSITTIFADEGEIGFRRREREAIARVVAMTPAVISAGGGALVDNSNVTALKRVSTIVWLTAPVDVLWRRITSDKTTADSRPPLTDRPGRQELEHLLAQRSPSYQRAADIVVDTADNTPREVAQLIAAKLNRGANPHFSPRG